MFSYKEGLLSYTSMIKFKIIFYLPITHPIYSSRNLFVEVISNRCVFDKLRISSFNYLRIHTYIENHFSDNKAMTNIQ